jgi:hypothetical protein
MVAQALARLGMRGGMGQAAGAAKLKKYKMA